MLCGAERLCSTLARTAHSIPAGMRKQQIASGRCGPLLPAGGDSVLDDIRTSYGTFLV